MRQIPYSILIFLFVSACDSPYQNRTPLPQAGQKANSEQSFVFEIRKLRVETQWTRDVEGNSQIKNELIVMVKDLETGQRTDPPSGLSLDFYSTMPSMGHPMADAGYFERLAMGIFINTSIRFNMPGSWQHELRLMDADFNIEEKILWNDTIY